MLSIGAGGADRLPAGESASPNFCSTAHGAYEAGVAAADAALKSLALRRGACAR
jgi:hypothetical protein